MLRLLKKNLFTVPEDASSVLLSLKTWKALKELTHALKWSDTGDGEDSGGSADDGDHLLF